MTKSEFVWDLEKRLGARRSIVGLVSELEAVSPEVILKHDDLIVAGPEQGAWDVEGLLGTNNIVATNIESIDNDCSVLPILNSRLK